MIALQTLGGFEVRKASAQGQVRLRLPPQPSALLVYLALARPTPRRTRDQVAAILWPELPDAGARGAFNQATFRLRQAMGQATVQRDGDDVWLQDVQCDAVAFETALQERRLNEALDVYAGDLLPGVYLSQSGEFERWIDEERERLRSRAVAAALEHARLEEQNGNSLTAVALLRRALGWSPYGEPVARELVRLLAHLGDRAGAVREYEAFRARLSADLSLPPPRDLEQWVQAVRSGAEQRHDSTRPSSGAARAERSLVETSAPPAAPDERHLTARAAPTALAAPTSSTTQAKAAGVHRWSPRLVRVSGAAAFLAIAVTAALVGRRNGRWTAPVNAPLVRSITVSPLFNETRDASLDILGRLAAERIADGVSVAGLAEVFQEDGASSGSSGAGRNARPDGAGIRVSGSYVRNGDSVLFRTRISHARTGALLTAVVEAAGPSERPESALELIRDRTVGALAPLLDERFASWARMASRPSSLEAYRAYAAGLDRLIGGRSVSDNIEALLRAARLDSTFAAPLVWALKLSVSAGHYARADSLARVLEPRRFGLAPWDRAMLDFALAQRQGDFAEAYAAMHRVAEMTPGSEWELELAHWALWINRPEEAIARLGRLDPEMRTRPYTPRQYWFTLLAAMHLIGDFEGVLASVDRMRRDQVEDRLASSSRLNALAAMGRVGEVNQVASGILASRSRRDGILVLDAAMELRVHGYSAASDKLLETLVEWYGALPDVDVPFVEHMLWATTLFAAGRFSDAREHFERIAAERPGEWTSRGYLGQIAALAGDREAAERELAWQAAQADHPNGGNAVIHAAAIAAELGDAVRAEQLARLAITRRLFHTHPAIHRDPRLQVLWRIPALRAQFGIAGPRVVARSVAPRFR